MAGAEHQREVDQLRVQADQVAVKEMQRELVQEQQDKDLLVETAAAVIHIMPAVAVERQQLELLEILEQKELAALDLILIHLGLLQLHRVLVDIMPAVAVAENRIILAAA